MGVAIVAIVVLVLGWLYLSSQTTKVVLTSEKSAYFPNDQINVTVLLENYKNTNQASVVVNYTDKLVLVDTQTKEGVTTRSLENSLVFEVDNVFFDTGKNRLGTITFDSNGVGEFNFIIDEELTMLSSSKGTINIEELVNLTVSVGIPSDEEGETKQSDGSSIDF